MKVIQQSHVHDLSVRHIEFLVERFGHREDHFAIESIRLPAELPPLMCGLHGPVMGDPPLSWTETTWAMRGNRTYSSRIISRPPRETRTMTVVFGFIAGECVLWTAYGGPRAPKELFDPSLQVFGLGNDEASRARIQESIDFWSVHALSAEAT